MYVFVSAPSEARSFYLLKCLCKTSLEYQLPITQKVSKILICINTKSSAVVATHLLYVLPFFGKDMWIVHEEIRETIEQC